MDDTVARHLDQQSAAPDMRLPVTVLSGFLGAARRRCSTMCSITARVCGLR